MICSLGVMGIEPILYLTILAPPRIRAIAAGSDTGVLTHLANIPSRRYKSAEIWYGYLRANLSLSPTVVL
jgi:hypothetical protein